MIEHIGLDEAIATAQSLVKGADSSDKLIWRQWICQLIIPELGTSEDDIKNVVLYPLNYTVPKPDDCKAIIEMALYDAAGCQLEHKYRAGSQRIYVDRRKVLSATTSTTDEQLNNLIPVDVSANAYSINLGTNGNLVAAIVLRYFTYPTDDAGLPLIRKEELNAVIMGLRYYWALRQNESRSEIDQNEKAWMLASDRCRARKKMDSVNHEVMKTVIHDWVRAIPKFDLSTF